MDFRTELTPKPSSWKIDLKDPVLTIGSCFSDSIGSRFFNNKFQVSANPFGTTYHPISIHKLLQFASLPDYPSRGSYLKNGDLFYNYNFHSVFHDISRDVLDDTLRQSITSGHEFLKKCKVLILTYGTAWIFERTDTGETVANCHKIPSSFFTKRLSTTEDIVSSFRRTYATLTTLNPELKIILTVSPVRHVNDTLALNSVSKSILRTACHQLSEEHPNVDYFPAYEIMLDDLRDYRFYKDDLIHPSEAAENYIWEKFSSCYFTPSTIAFLEKWTSLSKALSHKAFHPSGSAHQKFLRETLIQLEELKSLINVEDDIRSVKSRIL